jgi:hypothetical protein
MLSVPEQRVEDKMVPAPRLVVLEPIPEEGVSVLPAHVEERILHDRFLPDAVQSHLVRHRIGRMGMRGQIQSATQVTNASCGGT